MATFIKAGFWEKLCKPCKGYKGWLNLDEFVDSRIPAPTPPAYKVYTALLTQSGEEPPVDTVLENTTGHVFTIERGSIGSYYYTISGPDILDQSKVVILMGPYARFLNLPCLYSAYLNGSNTIYIYTTDVATLTEVDGKLTNAAIEIRVYN